MKQKIPTRKLVLTALMVGFILLLTYTPLGYLSIPPLAATTIHIPVIIGAAVLGPVYGAFLGLMFGLSSLIRALTQPDAFNVMFLNPLISVLPRVLCGFVAGTVFRVLAKRGHDLWGAGLCAAAGTLTNTVGVLGMLLIINPASLLTGSEISAKLITAALGGVIITNTVPEMLMAVLVTLGVYRAGRSYFKRNLT
ncbi:MAG: ECF transporter S component [Eubacteriales bacterium]|nr:ECF transporter S component [Eubacteriales bacterium]